MFNGSFWHGDPYNCTHDDLLFNKPVTDIWEKDYNKDRVAYNRGFNIIYVWYQSNRYYRLNDNVYKNPNNVILELIKIIGGNNEGN